jgi:nucleotide-binding universal stress UspA family protein
MIRTILVPMDGSRPAEAALTTASRLARSARASLRLVLVHEPEPSLVGAAAAPAETAESTPGAWPGKDREEGYLASLAARLQAGPATVEWEVCGGHPAETLEQCIAGAGPDLVVMAAHGRGSSKSGPIGAVADYLLRSVTVPILLIRPQGATDLPTPLLGFRSLLVPLDLGPTSREILAPVIAFARLTQSHVTLLHVVENGARPPGPPAAAPGARPVSDGMKARYLEAQRELDRLADRLRGRGVGASAKVVVADDVAGAILKELRGTRSDVIALTTYGASGFRERLLGSVADKVIRGSPRPILVLRPPPG